MYDDCPHGGQPGLCGLCDDEANDRSNWAATPSDQGGEPIDWTAVVFVGVLIALAIVGVLYVRV